MEIQRQFLATALFGASSRHTDAGVSFWNIPLMENTNTPTPSGAQCRSHLVQFVDTFFVCIWRGINLLVRRLPEKAAYRCAAWAGDLLYALRPAERIPLQREAKHLLRRTAPIDDAQAAALARQALRLYCLRQIELLRWQKMTGEDFVRLVEFSGLERLDAALAAGRGAILLTAHFGSFLMGPIALGYRGYPMHQVIGPALLNPRWTVQASIHQYREDVSRKFPMHFIVAKKTLKSVLQALAAGGVVVLAVDGREGLDWAPADFLGHAATFSPTVFKIAARTGAPIFPFFVHSRMDGTHTAAVEPAFAVPQTPDGAPDTDRAAALFAKILEERVLARPELFLSTIVSQRRRFRAGLAHAELYPPDDLPQTPADASRPL